MLSKARAAYESYLRRLDQYDLLEGNDKKLYEQYLENPDSFSTASTTDVSARRDAKIARFRAEKELKQKLEVGQILSSYERF